MAITNWAPVIGAVAAAVLTATVGFVTVLYANRRHGRWESIKTDLEIADLLEEHDPMRSWLREYADIRLRAYARTETGRRRDRTYWPIIAATFAVFLIAVFSGAIGLENAKTTADVAGSVGLILIALGALVTAVTLLSFSVGKSVFALRGVPQEMQGPPGADIRNLHERPHLTKRITKSESD